MGNSIFLSLLQNTSILLAFSILYEYLWVRKRDSISLLNQLLCGIIIGAIGIVLMLSSWEMRPGMVFDTRSVMLSISGLFFGFIPTCIAILITGIYRLVLGGEGVVMGVAVIISSGTIGILWHRIWPSIIVKLRWLDLLLMGFIVHAVMLIATIFLPENQILTTISSLALPLLTIYPVGNMLLGLFMFRQLENWENRKALFASQEKYSQLYDSMNDAFVVFDMNGNITECNTSYQELTMYSENELLKLNCRDLTPEKWIETDKKIIKERVIVNGSSELYEKECIKKNGSIIPVEIRIFLIKDDDAKPKGMWAIVRDISLRKKVINQLENERLRFKTIIETVPELIWLKDEKGVYVSCNKNFEKFVGIDKKDLIGKSDHDFYIKRIADYFFKKDLEAIRSNGIIRFTHWIKSKDTGEKLLMETMKTPMYDSDGKMIGVLGVSRDITEIKKTEEELLIAKERAEESDKLKSIFLANMSHEIRTPMNAIIGFSELLGNSDIDEEERSQYINIIQHSGNRLLQIINDIVDISKLELHQVSIKKSECNLYELFCDSIEVFQKSELLQSKPDIELILNYPENYRSISVITDFNRVQQVLDNLISNALKFTLKGKIEVGFDLVEKNTKTYVEVHVSDEGIGIPKDKHDIIFERFRQGDEDQFNDGTGLGLSISKGLVELLGGEIWFQSEEGKGTTFYFTIPFIQHQFAKGNTESVQHMKS